MDSIINIGERVIGIINHVAKLTVRQMLDFYESDNGKIIQLVEGKQNEIATDLSERIFNNLPSNIYTTEIQNKLKYEEELVNKIVLVINDSDTILFISELIKENTFHVLPGISFNDFGSVQVDVNLFRYFSISENDVFNLIDEDLEDILLEKKPLQTLISFEGFNNDIYEKILKNPELLNSIGWRQFETLLARLLESFDYKIELMKGSKDGGIDIIAISDDNVFGAHKYLLQAKRWKNKVGVEPVRELAFLQSHYSATKSCLATTSKFTSGAWSLANLYKWQLELRDFNGLLDWVKAANIIRKGL